MTCPDCDEAQEQLCDDAEQPRFYVRVGTANVEVVGCRRHVSELVERLRKASSPPAGPVVLGPGQVFLPGVEFPLR